MVVVGTKRAKMDMYLYLLKLISMKTDSCVSQQACESVDYQYSNNMIDVHVISIEPLSFNREKNPPPTPHLPRAV